MSDGISSPSYSKVIFVHSAYSSEFRGAQGDQAEAITENVDGTKEKNLNLFIDNIVQIVASEATIKAASFPTKWLKLH